MEKCKLLCPHEQKQLNLKIIQMELFLVCKLVIIVRAFGVYIFFKRVIFLPKIMNRLLLVNLHIIFPQAVLDKFCLFYMLDLLLVLILGRLRLRFCPKILLRRQSLAYNERLCHFRLLNLQAFLS